MQSFTNHIVRFNFNDKFEQLCPESIIVPSNESTKMWRTIQETSMFSLSPIGELVCEQ